MLLCRRLYAAAAVGVITAHHDAGARRRCQQLHMHAGAQRKLPL
jgi:hypothetical protein